MTSSGVIFWVVYDHPTDYPHGFIARRWQKIVGYPIASGDVLTSKSLRGIRQLVRESLQREGIIPHRILRSEEDDSVITEVWL